MTTSYRTQAANAVQATLLGNTVAGNRVYTKMDRPLQPDELPAILIYAQRAVRGAEDYGNSIIPRVMEVTIEVALQATPETALDQADLLVQAIEDLIEADPSLGHVVNNTRWRESVTDTTMTGKTTLGVGLLRYEVEVLTSMREPDAFGIGNDGFDGVPVTVYSVPGASMARLREPVAPDPGQECGPEGCAPPAWGGEVLPNGEPVV